ncbi:RpiB/LacA/LacB family sugar-phosphate isomerase [Candidatus Woesearchaeota archaeon]|nr:MAG: RpiB/LacA/LacB family sugar-phosphate isomerase [Candidatus Woesearchaeota archaeon]
MRTKKSLKQNNTKNKITHNKKTSKKEKPLIFIGADHAGVNAKNWLVKELKEKGYRIRDLGSHSSTAHDHYPLFAKKVGTSVLQAETNTTRPLGILICGTGTGMQIAANKLPGIRAAFCFDRYSARKAREDNDANILTLRARRFPRKELLSITLTFLTTKFSNKPRHKKRIELINNLERSMARKKTIKKQ